MSADERKLPTQRVAVVVFAEVEAVDEIDAEHVVEGMLQQQLRPRHDSPPVTVTRGAMTWQVDVHTIRGLSSAWNFVHLAVGDRAFPRPSDDEDDQLTEDDLTEDNDHHDDDDED